MIRGLHTKLVLIMLLLIVSLMSVVGAFLIRGVQGFYLSEFYSQMRDVFSLPEFVSDLRTKAGGSDAAEKMEEVIGAYSSQLGINAGTRNYFILRGDTGAFLAGSDPDEGQTLEMTNNILYTMSHDKESYLSDINAKYMDVALPISGDNGASFIVYIKDNKKTVQDLNMELFFIITEALIFGLIISVLLSFLLSKTMVTPIQSLTRAAERVSKGDFSEKIEVQTRDEIGILTNTFNDMATRLQNTLDDVRNERNKLITVFLHMTDGVVAFARDGSIMHYNPAAENMLGRTLEGSGETFQTLFGTLASMDAIFALKSPEYARHECNFDGKDLELSLAPFSGDGAQGGILAVIHDVTQQKKSEELRREFVANVSHELRTPITNIRSYAETLSDVQDLPPEMHDNFLKVILNESDRMTKIVQDLLTLSRFDAGSADFKYERFSFEKSVRNVYDSMSLEAVKHSLGISLKFDNELPLIVGDRARIEQVLLNILSNAVRYTPEGGSIAVRAGYGGGKVWMSVSDTGIGIPKEDLPRIFDRFYRVDKARSRVSGGTGLGLSIANDIVQRHNGRIDVVSELGKGTTMTVVLPADSALPV